VSHKSLAPSQSPSHRYIDTENQLKMAIQGKVFGMTDAEWSAKVNKNVQEWTADERDK
jgi:hypothetical protein